MHGVQKIDLYNVPSSTLWRLFDVRKKPSNGRTRVPRVAASEKAHIDESLLNDLESRATRSCIHPVKAFV